VQYLEEVARTRYKTGALAHGAVVKAQVEMGRLEDRLESLADLRGAHAARLNAALGRAAAAPVPWPAELPQPVVDVPEEQLLALLQRQSPQLEALRATVARRKKEVELAEKDFYPDFTLGLSYMDTGPSLMSGAPDSSTDPVLATVSLNLPIWRTKYNAGLRQARWSLLAARRQLDQQDYDLQSELKLALYQYSDSRRKIDLFGGALVPKAEESLRATRTAFEAGEADFLSLLDAERRLLEFRLAEERARADLLKAAARVEMLIGPLTEPPDGEGGQSDAGGPEGRHVEGETS
jgi:outer membrane protein TolC